MLGKGKSGLVVATRFGKEPGWRLTSAHRTRTSPVIAREPTPLRAAAHDADSLSFPRYL
jgi:hypothetical protein